jgi:NAD dependent epimerase/dehydratase
MKKIFVTGGGGFIGSHLIEKLLEQNYKVKVLVEYEINNRWGWIDTLKKEYKDKLKIVIGDIRDFNLILNETKGVDVIYHLAALISIPYSYKAPESYIDTNVKGTLNLLNASINNKIKLFVHTSTSEVYGSAQYVPIDEKHPINAQSPYAASKVGADQLAMSFYKSFGLPVTIIRPFNTFGPRQSLRAIIPTIINQSIKDNKIKLGNLDSLRDFTFVDDTVRGFILAMKHKKCIGEVINLGTGYEFTIKETLKIILKISKNKGMVNIEKKRLRPKKSEVDRLLSNNKKAGKILKWKPKYAGKKGFEAALNLTFKWFNIEDNTKFYKTDIYNI